MSKKKVDEESLDRKNEEKLDRKKVAESKDMNKKKKKKSGSVDFKTVKRLLKYATGIYKFQFVVVIISIIVSSIANVMGIQFLQKLIDDFTPDNNVSYNVQDGFDGKQFNEHDQMVTRINNQAGFYEKYKYDSTEDEQYSEMMRYKPNGYKAEYWKVETLKDANGAEFKGKVQYILDEGEKIYKVVLPPNAAVDQNLVDFNSYMLYSKVLKYEQELEESRE